MNIAILTYGSRGDVQPFLPLSRGLMERGHKVILAAPTRFKNLVEENGSALAELAGDPEELSRKLNGAGYNFIKQVRELMTHAVSIGAQVIRQTDEACKDADLIIHTFAHAVGAHTLAREKNIPDVYVDLFPMFAPTGDYPNVSLPDFGFRPYNRLTHIVAAEISWLASRLGFEQIRRRNGLPERKLFFPFKNGARRLPTLILCAWSPSLIPPPSDFPPNAHIVGYFFSPPDEAYLPPPELDSFLKSGQPPVCVSFGSMVNKDAKRIDDIVRQSLRRTKNRGVILSGWGGAANSSSSEALCLEPAPHNWLLPKCKMVVHHGGAGTTAAGLRAGVPNIIVPFMADQPFWDKRVNQIGAGPKPIAVKKLSAENLSRAILEAQSQSMVERAKRIGEKIRAEDGVANAIQLIESHARRFAIL